MFPQRGHRRTSAACPGPCWSAQVFSSLTVASGSVGAGDLSVSHERRVSSRPGEALGQGPATGWRGSTSSRHPPPKMLQPARPSRAFWLVLPSPCLSPIPGGGPMAAQECQVEPLPDREGAGRGIIESQVLLEPLILGELQGPLD